MTYALHGICNGFLINDAAGSEIHIHIETLPNQVPVYLCLHLPHNLSLNFFVSLIPYDMKLRLLLLELPELLQHHSGIHSVRQ